MGTCNSWPVSSICPDDINIYIIYTDISIPHLTAVLMVMSQTRE